MNSIQIYQNPYVDVFQAFKLYEWKLASKKGDVKDCTDEVLKQKVLTISGTTSQQNFIQLPDYKNMPKSSLGLTGKFLYLVIKKDKDQHFAMHFDYIVNDTRPVRLSLSSMYTETKKNGGTGLQVSLKNISTEKWNVVAISIPQLFEDKENGVFTSTDQKKFYLRGLTICANICVKGIYTSDKDFYSHIPQNDKKGPCEVQGQKLTWQQKWKGIDVWNEDSKLALKIPFDKEKKQEKNWTDLYKWVMIPHDRKNQGMLLQEKAQTKKPILSKGGKSDKNVESKVKFEQDKNEVENADLTNVQAEGEKQIDKIDAASLKEEDTRIKEQIKAQTEELRVAQETFKERIKQEAEKIKEEYNYNLESKHIKPQQEVNLFQTENFYDPNKSQRRNCESFVLKPEPIMKLDRVLGVHPEHTSHAVFYNKDPKLQSELIYTQANCIIGYHDKLQQQRLLLQKEVGEITKFIVTKGYCVTLSSQENGKTVRKSGEPETELLLAVWCLETTKILKIVKPPLQKLTNIDISSDQTALVVSGKDLQGRELILVYSFQDLIKFKKIELLARQQADFQLLSLKFIEGLNNCLIGVGKSFEASSTLNDKLYEPLSFIRIFKIKNNYLPSQMVTLNQTAKNTFFNNSCKGQSSFRDAKGQFKVNSFYVTTDCGLVYIINMHSRQVEKVLQLHDCKIVSIINTPKFIFTASRNSTTKSGSLKIWAPDFAKLISEIPVNQEIIACDVNQEANQIAVLSLDGTLSQLEIDNSTFKVIMRSHQNNILEIAYNKTSGTIVSIGEDSSIKVWEVECLCQIHEFNTAQSDPPTKIVSSPYDGTIAVGFKSGFLRLFDLSSPEKQIKQELMIFDSEVKDLQFTKQRKFLAAFYKCAKIIIFNVEEGDLNPINAVKSIDYEFPQPDNYSLAFSDDGVYLANISSNANIITVWETKNFGLKWYIDLTGDTLRKVMFAPNGCDLLALTTSSKLKYLRLNPNVAEVETVREQYGITDLTPTDFLVTPNNKYIICAGQDGHIKIYDYFMRGQMVAAQQAFIGHLKFAQSLCLQDDMRYLYTVGEGNGIYRWAFYGDQEMPQDLSALFEKTTAEIKREEEKENQKVQLPTFKENELKAYTEDQIAQLRKDILEGRQDSQFAAINQISVPRPNKELIEDGGISLKRRPKIEYTPAGYTYEQHNIELQKILGCSVRPQVGQNLVWDIKNRNFSYSLQNKLVFEELNQTKDQMLKQEFQDPIHGLELSGDGKLILAYTQRGMLDGFPQIIVWDTKTRRKVSQITVEEKICKAVKFSNYSNMLLVASYDDENQRSYLKVWDFLDGRREYLCESRVVYEINDVKWNPYLASGTDEFVSISDNIYHYWRIDQKLQMQYQIGKLAPNFTGKFTCVSFVEPMQEQCSVYMLLGLSTGEVWVCDTRTNSYLHSAKVLDCAVHRLISSVNRIIVEGEEERSIQWWELKKTINDFDYDASNPDYFFAGDSKQITLDGWPSASYYDETAAEALVISTNNSIWLVNFIEAITVRLKSCHEPTTYLNSCDFKYVSPNEYQCETNRDQNYIFDQNYLVGSTGTDGVIKIWSMYDLEHCVNFMVPKEQCNAVAMHQFKPFMIASFSDGFIRFFDLDKAKNLGRCKINSADESDENDIDNVIQIRILPSGEHVLCATEKGQVFLIYIESWVPLSISIQNLVSLCVPVSCFDVSFLEPYNKWLIGGKHGKVVVYNRQDCNSFKQELFDKLQPPTFIFMDSFNLEEYVDNCFTEAKRINTLDHFYGISQRQIVENQDDPNNYTQAQFLNNDLASYICFVKKCQSLLIRNFELHQVVKKIDLKPRIVQMQMAPGSAPYVHLITETNEIFMIDFVNEKNRNTVLTMHEQVKTLKVCPNGRYLLTAGIKGDIALWSVNRVKTQI